MIANDVRATLKMQFFDLSIEDSEDMHARLERFQ